MPSELDQRLAQKVVDQYQAHLMDTAESVDLLLAIVEMAAIFWQDIDTDDFCIQLVASNYIVFGGTNRIKWTPAHGFQIDRCFCTKRFQDKFDQLMAND